MEKIMRITTNVMVVILLAANIISCKTKETTETNALKQEFKGEPFLVSLKKAVPDADAIFYGQITNFAAAFHQPILIDSSIEDLLSPKNSDRNQMIDFLIVDKLHQPTYACHEMAQDLRQIAGTTGETTAGGYGQAQREAAIDAAIAALKKNELHVISLKNTSRSDDGHSFTLIERADGYVDTLEGWASDQPTDISTGQNFDLDKKLVIEALEKIRLDPTNPEHDKRRGEGYGYLSQAYGTTAVSYHEQGRERSIELYQIPRNKDGLKRVDIPQRQMTRVYYDDAKAMFVGRDAERKDVTFAHFPERADGEIEILASIRSLDAPTRIESKLKERLAGQQATLDKYVLKRRK
ncbi:MAG: hypothetical protein CMP10_18070 [Zetaproteobacteria bacterium]|nr:hypothetical protein [Pseudobdellovibrionaceae bacterium]